MSSIENRPPKKEPGSKKTSPCPINEDMDAFIKFSLLFRSKYMNPIKSIRVTPEVWYSLVYSAHEYPTFASYLAELGELQICGIKIERDS